MNPRIGIALIVLGTSIGPVSGGEDGADDVSPELFRHRYIADDLPGDRSWGYGVSALADFDSDGDLDYAVAVRNRRIHWFENRGDGSWQRHVVGPIPMTQLGSTAMDVDADGHTDIVIGRYWYRNSSSPRDQPFTRHEYDDRIASEIHDIVTADVDGDGQRELVVLGDGDGCFWYDIPDDPARDANWPRTTITLAVLDDRDDIHAGFFPQGVGDLDADGDPDLVMPGRWYENRQDGQEWVKHEHPFGRRGGWGLSTRSWITDLDGDGDADIVIADCDQAGSRIAWLESDGGDPPSFQRRMLPQVAEGERGSFHSLAVADFDRDGDRDILAVEQEDPVILPGGRSPRWYLWENDGGDPPSFTERVILDGRLGGHDARIGDVDGDGDIDIVSKIWKRWPGNANNGREHLDLLENLAADRAEQQ